MARSPKKYEIEMINGPIFINLIRFAVPIICSTVLKLLYHAADMIVIGRFVGAQALAAIGATGQVYTLLINLFMGFSVGANVAAARYFGSGKKEEVSQSVHTSVLMAVLGGVLVAMVSIPAARPLLRALSTPADILDLAVLYISICLAGAPITLLYDFCAAILRAVGDTKRPLYYLMLSGALNVALNFLFVPILKWGVAGVAAATVLSQSLSTALIVGYLMKYDGDIGIDIKKLKICRDKFLEIIKVGLPAVLQTSMFTVSNTIIQSAINSFGSAAIAGNSIAGNIEGFVSVPMSGFYQGAMSFTAQNYGAGKYERFSRIALSAAMLVTCTGLTLGILAVAFARPLIGIYTSDAAVVDWAVIRMYIMVIPCFISDVGEVYVYCLRGLGNAVTPMITSILGICVFRMIWIFTVFAAFHTEFVLYIAYPISWTTTLIAHYICFMIHKKKVSGRMKTGIV